MGIFVDIDQAIKDLQRQKDAIEDRIILALGKELLSRFQKTCSLEEAMGSILAQPSQPQREEAWAEALALFHQKRTPQRTMETTYCSSSIHPSPPSTQKKNQAHG
jgi:hypothetical protein